MEKIKEDKKIENSFNEELKKLLQKNSNDSSEIISEVPDWKSLKDLTKNKAISPVLTDLLPENPPIDKDKEIGLEVENDNSTNNSNDNNTIPNKNDDIDE